MSKKQRHKIDKIWNTKIIITVLILVFFGMMLVFSSVNAKYKRYFETGLRKMTDYHVVLGDINVSFISNTIQLRDIEIHPPENAPDNEEMIHIDRIRINAESLETRPTPINSLNIHGVKIYLRQDDNKDLNFTSFLRQLSSRGHDNDFTVTIAPNRIFIRDIRIFSESEQPPSGSRSVSLADYVPLSENNETKNVPIETVSYIVFRAVGKDMRKALIAGKIDSKIQAGKKSWDNLMRQFSIMGEDLENELFEFWNDL